MGRRPEVDTASPPKAAAAVIGLGAHLATAAVTTPLHQPFDGPDQAVQNLGQNVTRRVMRSFFDYFSSVDTPTMRSLELVIDELAGAVLPPFVRRLKVATGEAHLGGVPGVWYRPADREPRGAILYFHGGGYIATSPRMYAAFTGYLSHITGCRLFVADYRLAPEFPFPAALVDGLAVYEDLLDSGIAPERVIFAGDSGGGGLVSSLLLSLESRRLPKPAGAILLSPEVELTLAEPSLEENAEVDILPPVIPTEAYLHGTPSTEHLISPGRDDLSAFPPALVAFGDEEVFRDAIRRFCDDLRSDGVPVVELEEPDMFHVYPILMPWAAPSHRLYGALRSFVTERFAEPLHRADER